MSQLTGKKPFRIHLVYIFIALLFIVSAFVLVGVTLDIQQLHRAGAFPARRGFTFRRYSTGVVPKVSFIDTWMTFSYVNQVFGLPPAYLQQRFKIAYAKYPNVQIARFAKDNGMETSSFLIEVREAVSQYQLGAGTNE